MARLFYSCVLVIAVVGCCRPAAAEFFQFSTIVTIGAPYNVGPGDPVMFTTTGGTDITVNGLAFSGPGNLGATGSGTDIIFAEINVDVDLTSPLEALVIPFTFDLNIVDFPTNNSGISDGNATFSISGNISGSIGDGLKVNLNTITPLAVGPMIIDDEIYTLTFNSNFYAPPGPFFEGRIGVHVSSAPVPEPGTLALATVGTIVLATPALRRLRRQRRRMRIN